MEKRQTQGRRWPWWPLVLLAVLLLAGVLFWRWRTPSTILYRDRELAVQREVPRSHYKEDHFLMDEQGRMSYKNLHGEARLGIDVSYYQEDIDWEAVADDGIEFAIIRIGYRGYGSGAIKLDQRFEENLQEAKAAGLEVGVYFFSQAITPQEAAEEADFVLAVLAGRELEYPVVFDWEWIEPGKNARTDHMTGQTMTECAAAFAQRIEAGGYEPMIYFNTDMGYLDYELAQLKDWPFWLARYSTQPDFYYDFDLWQFSHTGQVAGIQGNVDLNLDLRTVK